MKITRSKRWYDRQERIHQRKQRKLIDARRRKRRKLNAAA